MRKITTVLLCAVLLLLSLCLPAAAAGNTKIQISNKEEFLSFAQSCRLDSFSMGLTVSLEADIDLTGTDFEPIPVFCGIFDGNGHTVSGLNILQKGSWQGLFRYLTQTAVVKDLHVSGKVQPQGSRSGVGGIAGSNAGQIKNCTFTGTVSGSSQIGGIAGVNLETGDISFCTVSGSVSGVHFAGGIAGENAGMIRLCENLSHVNNTPKDNSVDITDITVGTLTGTEAVNTVTDIGGIAGANSGTIWNSYNKGNIGYPHIGYNIGGIAGSQIGFIQSCENRGAVSGRKEVGGIAGQMEPWTVIQYETDTLQLLREEMKKLTVLIDRATANAQENTDTVQSLLDALEAYALQAQQAIDVLTVDPEAPEIRDIDTYLRALKTLADCMSGINKTLSSLSQALEDTADDLEKDLQDISAQVDLIEKLLDTAEDNLGGSVEDVSDGDTEEDRTSKIYLSRNYGPVLGDFNTGGIVGAIALENDLDPEEDVLISGSSSLNVATKLRSVILKCRNYGELSGKKQNSGGIVGWQSMGLVKDCVGLGALSGGDYTGGIAGQSLGYIRSSWAKGVISGGSHTGGIAGMGTVVTDSRSMTKLSGTEYVGGILGSAAEGNAQQKPQINGNFYAPVGKDPGGIDGISYHGAAQTMELEAFLALENIPEPFKTVKVTFCFADGKEMAITLVPGSGLAEQDIPQLPQLEGYTGRWNGLEQTDLSCVLSDLTFDAVYTSHDGVLAGGEYADNRPILLVLGDFAPGSQINMKKPEIQPEVHEEESLLESWMFAVSGGEKVSAVRYLLPKDADPEKLRVYVHSTEGEWEFVNHSVDGSYLVVKLGSQADGIALAQSNQTDITWLWWVLGAGLLTVTVAFSICIYKKGRKSSREQAEV